MKAGGAAGVKRYRLEGPREAFDFTNGHRVTPPRAFEAMMAGQDDATSVITRR